MRGRNTALISLIVIVIIVIASFFFFILIKHEVNERNKRSKKNKSCNVSCRDLVVKGNATFGGRVRSKIAGTYYVKPDGTGDFPTIQSALDFASSGIIPDGIVNIKIMPGTYYEVIHYTGPAGDPAVNDPLTDVSGIKGKGIRVVTDERPIANMCYKHMGKIYTDGSYMQDSGVNSLGGHYGAYVFLSNVGNTITVTLSSNPQPNFKACGLVKGDDIVFATGDGSYYDRKIVSVSGNSVTYDGAPLVSGPIMKGSGLIFGSNVVISVPDDSNASAAYYHDGGVIELTGVHFKPLSTGTFYGLFLTNGGSHLYTNRMFIDLRSRGQDPNFPAADAIVCAPNGARISVALADNDVNGHMVSLPFGMNATGIFNGDWYSFSTVFKPGFGDACMFQALGSGVLSTAQINGSGQTDGLRTAMGGQIGPIAFFNELICTNCTIGLNLNDFTLLSIPNISIDNCHQAMSLRDSKVQADNGITITDCDIGINGDQGSEVITGGDITFINTPIPYQMTGKSSLNIPNSTYAPNNIFTYNSNQDFDAGNFTHQMIDSSNPITISLDASQVSETNQLIYVGNKYDLYSQNALTHKLQLTGPGMKFIGAGITGTKTAAVFSTVGSGLSFFVKSSTIVVVTSSSGVTFVP